MTWNESNPDLPQAIEDENVCICADCGNPAPQWIEDESSRLPGHNGIWADCSEGECGTITGVEFDAHDLPQFVGGQGTNYDWQFHLRHFGEHHTPDLEAVVACLRYEAVTPFNGCPTCQDLRGAEVRINDLDEMACPNIKTQCIECVEIECETPHDRWVSSGQSAEDMAGETDPDYDEDDDDDGYTQDDIEQACYELREFAVVSCGCVDDGITNAMFDIIAKGKEAIKPTKE